VDPLNVINAEPWKEILPRKCTTVGQAPVSTGTGALVVLVLIALAVFELDKRVPR
jgi:hypothetical protein